MDISKVCRSCMKEVTSWELGNFNKEAVDMFKFCTKIEIADDNLPKQICFECEIKVEASYTYIKKAMEVDAKLKNLASNPNTNITEPDPDVAQTPLISEKEIDTFQIDNSIQDELRAHYSDLKETDVLEGPHAVNKKEVSNTETTTNNCKGKKLFTCEICDKSFTTKRYVSRHLMAQHCKGIGKEPEVEKEKEQVTCPFCSKTFYSKVWYNRHMIKEHDAPEHKCLYCPKSFGTKQQFLLHLSNHTESRKHVCSTCSKRFQKRKQLVAHERTHDDLRPYACDTCGMTFKAKNILISHLNTHTNDKPFLCDLCGAGFAQLTNMKAHRLTHTGEKPHACPDCPFRSAFACSLQRHRRQHEAQRPHCCAVCLKAFYEPSALARHERTHSGAKPYPCSVCPRKFSDSWKRKAHMMRAHDYALNEIPKLNRTRKRSRF